MEYRFVVLHKEFQEYLGNFRVAGTFEPAEEFQATGEQGVGHAEGDFAEQKPLCINNWHKRWWVRDNIGNLDRLQ